MFWKVAHHLPSVNVIASEMVERLQALRDSGWDGVIFIIFFLDRIIWQGQLFYIIQLTLEPVIKMDNRHIPERYFTPPMNTLCHQGRSGRPENRSGKVWLSSLNHSNLQLSYNELSGKLRIWKVDRLRLPGGHDCHDCQVVMIAMITK